MAERQLLQNMHSHRSVFVGIAEADFANTTHRLVAVENRASGSWEQDSSRTKKIPNKENVNCDRAQPSSGFHRLQRNLSSPS